MVDALRSTSAAELALQPSAAELTRFARDDELPRITIDVSARTGDPVPPVGAAIYRIAQESITNALRHARQPSEIAVAVDGDGDWMRLSITDDGEARVSGRDFGGFGLIGIRERAKLLGGRLEAGPVNGRGWRVEAVLPRLGAAR